MADLLSQYEEYLTVEKHASQNTLSSYLRDLHQFAAYLDEFRPMPLPQVTQEVINGYVVWMGGKESPPRRSRAPSHRSSRFIPTFSLPAR